jgi:hypothetical protein
MIEASCARGNIKRKKGITMKKYTQEELDQAILNGQRDFRDADCSGLIVKTEITNKIDFTKGKFIPSESFIKAFFVGQFEKKPFGIRVKLGNLEKIKNV